MSLRTGVAAVSWKAPYGSGSLRARFGRWAGLLLLAVSAGSSGCSTAPVIANLVRGRPGDVQAASFTEPATPAPTANPPSTWGTAKDPDRVPQWAETRASAPVSQPTPEAQAAWRTQNQAQVAGPILAQGPLLGAQANAPAQPNEPAPPPRVLTNDKVPHGPAPAIVLGAPVPKAPYELHKVSLPPYTVAPPDILLVESTRGLPTQPVRGQHLVRPDGTINLGVYGSVYVAGMTLDQIAGAVAKTIESRLDPKAAEENPVKPEDVSVDVLAYNSKVYYVITDGAGYGEQVYKFPVTGNDTVMDAIANIGGLPAVSSKHIWVARRTPCGAHPVVLPVDWCGTTQRGESATNYQLFPGDRVYVKGDHLITVDTWLAKLLAPVERVLGVTLLGSSTVNSIRNSNNTTTGQ
jgi:polysaccharide export outer membrane protein